jgi:hypothetical protein
MKVAFIRKVHNKIQIDKREKTILKWNLIYDES